jgi:hypothetical protein
MEQGKRGPVENLVGELLPIDTSVGLSEVRLKFIELIDLPCGRRPGVRPVLVNHYGKIHLHSRTLLPTPAGKPVVGNG